MPPVISRFRVTYELLIDRPIQFIPYLLRNRIRPREINKRRGVGAVIGAFDFTFHVK